MRVFHELLFNCPFFLSSSWNGNASRDRRQMLWVEAARGEADLTLANHMTATLSTKNPATRWAWPDSVWSDWESNGCTCAGVHAWRKSTKRPKTNHCQQVKFQCPSADVPTCTAGAGQCSNGCRLTATTKHQLPQSVKIMDAFRGGAVSTPFFFFLNLAWNTADMCLFVCSDFNGRGRVLILLAQNPTWQLILSRPQTLPVLCKYAAR